MAEEMEKRGNELFVLEEYDQALECYTKAIVLNPSKPSLYLSRASAHSKLENWTDAVADANKTIELDPSLPKAYLRKGIACFALEEYEAARAAFLAGASRGPLGSTFESWIQKCNAKLDEKPALNTKELAGFGSATNGVHAGTAKQADKDKTQTPISTSISTPTPTPTPTPDASVPKQLVQPKFRHEWYQAQTHVVVSIFAKGVKNDDVKIDFGEQMLSVIIQSTDGVPYVLQIRLFGKVKTSECSYKVLSTKLEVRLVKAEAVHWKELEYDKRQGPVQQLSKVSESDVPQTRYPSSSKKASTNWDKLEAEVKKEEKDEKLEGDAALNKLFRDIYQSADEDTRRAMNKSFVESNGTVLSTNWKEVGTKTIEGSAPKGMEMRKWEA